MNEKYIEEERENGVQEGWKNDNKSQSYDQGRRKKLCQKFEAEKIK
jgi:hypothetical protein